MVIRDYTITYLDNDGTTELHIESLAYGASVSYAASKSGYVFEGWSATNDGSVDEELVVTGDMTLYAVYSEAGTLDDISWETIATDSLAGVASEKYSVGDTKTVILTNSDGTTETVMAVIAGFKLHRNTDGIKDGITFIYNRRSKNTQSASGSSYNEINSTETARSPDELTAVIRPSMIDGMYYYDSVLTRTSNVNFFCPELTNISSSLKTEDGTTTLQVYNPYTQKNINMTQINNTYDADLFPLFSGMSASDIAKFFGLANGASAFTRTLLYARFNSTSSSAGRVAIRANTTYGACKANTSGSQYALICFRV